MQVVYSGGSTPSPSPRVQRKTGYGRPIMPGYMTHVHPQIFVQRSREKLTEGDITLRDSIPAMSKCTATVCLVLNIILPGSGTLTAGLSVLCCSHVRPKGDSKGHCIWVNAGVALLQFLLTFLFLLGWIWSIMWGMAFLSVSKKYFFAVNKETNRKHRNNADKTHKQIPNSAEQLRTTTSRTKMLYKRCNFNEQQRDSHHHEQCYHHLEHYRRPTLKEFSQEDREPGLNVTTLGVQEIENGDDDNMNKANIKPGSSFNHPNKYETKCEIVNTKTVHSLQLSGQDLTERHTVSSGSAFKNTFTGQAPDDLAKLKVDCNDRHISSLSSTSQPQKMLVFQDILNPVGVNTQPSESGKSGERFTNC